MRSTRSLAALGALALLCLAAGACGGSTKPATHALLRSTTHAGAGGTTTRSTMATSGSTGHAAARGLPSKRGFASGSPVRRPGEIAVAPIPPAPRITIAQGSLPRSDEDGDNPRDTDSVGDPDPYDGDIDTPVMKERKFPDADDAYDLGHGSAPSAADRRAILRELQSYFVLARSADAAKACARLVPALAASVTSHSTVRRPGETCQTAMSTLFARSRHELSAPVKVADVRIEYRVRAEAVLGSRTMPASVMFLRRQGGTWMIDQVLPMRLS